MLALLGIDCGTSSVKAVVVGSNGRLLATATQEYPLHSPQPGWAEQEPEAWWQATVWAVQRAMAQAGVRAVTAIGFSGQMHGTVLIDRAAQPVGPAIIWADQRSAAEVTDIITRLGRERLAQITGTAPAAGFMASTLLWLKRHDPARLAQATAVLLPKDYLRLRLTGEIASEASDVSSTGLADVAQRSWSPELVAALELPASLLPPVLEPADLAGQLPPEAAQVLGLPAGIPVVAGCADQVAQAVGNGLLDPGQAAVTVGSGGQLFVPLSQPLTDSHLRLHTFCHAPPNRWYLLGAMLTAGLSLRWLRNLLGDGGTSYEALSAQAAAVPSGANGLLFLPYLAGERSPLMDPLARGCFVGLTLRHGRGHLARAIMEGVALGLRHILATMQTVGEKNVMGNGRLLAVGNGMSSPIWRQIVADVLQRPLALPVGEEKAGVGAALLAGLGAGVYGSYSELGRLIPLPVVEVAPNPAVAQLYTDQYNRFLRVYPLLRETLHDLSRGDG